MLGRVLRLGLVIDWLRVLPILACTALAAALPVGVPLLLGSIIDAALRGSDIVELLPQLGLVTVLAAGAALAEVLANTLGARVGYSLSWQLAGRLYGQLLRMPLLSYATINPGVLNSRLTNDMRMVDPLFTAVPLATVHGWVGLVAVGIALAIINPWFLVAFALIPLALMAVRFSEGRINATIKDSYEINAAVASQIEGTTGSDAVSLVRQARATETEEGRFAELADKSVALAARMDNWRAVINVAYRLCFDLITVLFLGTGVSGSMEKANLGFIIRDFDNAGLAEKEVLLEAIVREVMLDYPRSSYTFTVREQYRNMKQVLDKHPEIVANAEEAIRRAGMQPKRGSIRGGTDGSRLSFMGLPCPNIFAGGHAFHSPLEWISRQDMEKAVTTLVELARVWEERA